MIIQSYRGKLDEGGIKPLSILNMNGRYSKLQYFEIILPKLEIPAKVVQALEVSPAVTEAQGKLDKLIAKDEYLEATVVKQKLLMRQAEERVTNHTFNVVSFDDQIKGMEDIAKADKKPDDSISMAHHVANEEQVSRAKEKKVEAQSLLKQAERELKDVSKAYNQAHKNQDENNKLKQKQIAIIEETKQESLLGATKNWAEVFKYEGDGRVQAIQAYTYKEYNALTKEYIPCDWFSLGLEGNVIKMINQMDHEAKTGKGDVLGVSLIIGS